MGEEEMGEEESDTAGTGEKTVIHTVKTAAPTVHARLQCSATLQAARSGGSWV